MDTERMREIAGFGRMNCTEKEKLEILIDVTKEAADRIDELESRQKGYHGATVVEVDEIDMIRNNCIFWKYAIGHGLECQISKCCWNCHGFKYRPADCPLSRGVVIIKMKKE